MYNFTVPSKKLPAVQILDGRKYLSECLDDTDVIQSGDISDHKEEYIYEEKNSIDRNDRDAGHGFRFRRGREHRS